MIRDRARVDPYLRALEKCVGPESVVLDLGSGFGFFACIAAKLGARRVYAMELSSSLQLGARLAQANQLEKKIEFIQGNSRDVSLPERVDILLSDLRGVLPFCESSLRTLIDARERFLKPGGRLIPKRDSLWASLLSSPRHYESVTTPWDRDDFELSWREGRDLALSSGFSFEPGKGERLTKPKCLGQLVYAELSTERLSFEATFEMTRSGLWHGLVVWFDTELWDGIGFSNSPLLTYRPQSYGSHVLPWKDPWDLEVGDRVEIVLDVEPTPTGFYHLSWSARCRERSQHSSTADLESLDRVGYSRDHRAELGQLGKVQLHQLRAMDEGKSVEEIATSLVSRFPDRFSGREDAYREVARNLVRYSKPPDEKVESLPCIRRSWFGLVVALFSEDPDLLDKLSPILPGRETSSEVHLGYLARLDDGRFELRGAGRQLYLGTDFEMLRATLQESLEQTVAAQAPEGIFVEGSVVKQDERLVLVPGPRESNTGDLICERFIVFDSEGRLLKFPEDEPLDQAAERILFQGLEHRTPAQVALELLPQTVIGRRDPGRVIDWLARAAKRYQT